MATSKDTEDQVWVVQPDHAKAFDENCVGEGWVIRPSKKATLGQIGDGISIKSIFKDIKVYIPSKTKPKISLESDQDIFSWNFKSMRYSFGEETAIVAEYSDTVSEKDIETYEERIQKGPKIFVDEMIKKGWELIEHPIFILAPLKILKCEADNDANFTEKKEVNSKKTTKENNEENIMAGDITVKVVISEGSKEVLSVPISYNSFATVVSEISDSEANQAFFAEAAKHAAPNVRENVAYKENLDKATVDLLSKDTSVNVLRNLVRTAAFKKYAKQDLIEKLIATDAEVATTIAGDLEAYEQGDMNKSIDLIIKMNNPFVINSIANNYSTPKKVLKTLMSYPDPLIAFDAKARYEDS